MEPLQITVSVLVSLILMFISYILGQSRGRKEMQSDLRDLRLTLESHHQDYAADIRGLHGRLSRLEGRVFNGQIKK